MSGFGDRWDVPRQRIRGPVRRAMSERTVRRGPVRPGGGPSRPSAVSSRQTSLLANPSAYKRDAHEPDYIILVTVVIAALFLGIVDIALAKIIRVLYG